MRTLALWMLFACGMAAAPASSQTMTATGSFDVRASTMNVSDSRSGAFPGPVNAQAQYSNVVTTATGSGWAQGRFASVDVSWSSNCPSLCILSATASADVVITLSAPVPMSGVIAVLFALDTGSTGTVDVGADGLVELTTGGTDIPVVITPAGLRIRATCRASSGYGSLTGSYAHVGLAFLPRQTPLTTFGPTCGVELQGALFLDWFGRWSPLQLECGQAPQTPFAFLIIGITQLDVPIPPTNCPLLTDLPIAIPIVLSSGRSINRFPLPPVPGLTFFSQIIVSESPPPDARWRTSNAVSVRLP